LIYQIEKYKERYGYYPESVHADKIYQNRENRKYCKDRDLRMTEEPLGRPPIETEIFLSIFVINLDKMCSIEMREIEERFKIRRNRVA
jgi:hypothetical protein